MHMTTGDVGVVGLVWFPDCDTGKKMETPHFALGYGFFFFTLTKLSSRLRLLYGKSLSTSTVCVYVWKKYRGC